MSFPTAVDEQTRAAAADASTVLQDAPGTAMSNFMIATSQALSNAAHNATTSQQQTNVTAQAAMAQGVATLYAVDTASTGKATQEIFT